MRFEVDLRFDLFPEGEKACQQGAGSITIPFELTTSLNNSGAIVSRESVLLKMVKEMAPATPVSPADNVDFVTSGNGVQGAEPRVPAGGLGRSTDANAADPVSTATREFFFYQHLMDLRGGASGVWL